MQHGRSWLRKSSLQTRAQLFARIDLAFARRLLLDLLWFAEAFLLRRNGAALLAAKVARFRRADRFAFQAAHRDSFNIAEAASHHAIGCPGIAPAGFEFLILTCKRRVDCFRIERRIE